MSKLSIADEVFQFDSVEAFSSRPNYFSELIFGDGDLGTVIAKYELSDNEAAWAICGLNNCRQKHKYGFLISNTQGQETNCGQHCGSRELGGVRWAEVIAQFKERMDEQARRRAIVAWSIERDSLLKQAQIAIEGSDATAKKLKRFIDDFQGKSKFWDRLIDVARLDGRIRTAIDESSEGGSRNSAVQLMTIGRLAGSQILLSGDFTRHQKLLSFQVLPWLRDELGVSNLEALDARSLEKLSSAAMPMRRMLTDAQEFVSAGEAFFSAENLLGIELIREKLLPRSANTDALHRAIKRWTAVAPL